MRFHAGFVIRFSAPLFDILWKIVTLVASYFCRMETVGRTGGGGTGGFEGWRRKGGETRYNLRTKAYRRRELSFLAYEFLRYCYITNLTLQHGISQQISQWLLSYTELIRLFVLFVIKKK